MCKFNEMISSVEIQLLFFFFFPEWSLICHHALSMLPNFKLREFSSSVEVLCNRRSKSKYSKCCKHVAVISVFPGDVTGTINTGVAKVVL